MFEQYFIQLEASPAFLMSVVFVLSLMVGSFLNVVIYRLPLMMQREWQQECRISLADELANSSKQTASSNDTFNLIKPNSTCPHCKTPIKAWHNIPLLGWLFKNTSKLPDLMYDSFQSIYKKAVYNSEN